MGKTACFTGHRPNKLGGYSGFRAEKIQSEVKEALSNVIIKLYEQGFDTFISGGAVGVDQLAGWAVLEQMRNGLELKLIIAKPFPSQDAKWPKHIQVEFNQLCNAADEIVNVSEDPYSVEKMHLRNRWMVDKSEVIIAVYNGGYGGTKNCVDYAKETKKGLITINPYTLKERWECML